MILPTDHSQSKIGLRPSGKSRCVRNRLVLLEKSKNIYGMFGTFSFHVTFSNNWKAIFCNI